MAFTSRSAGLTGRPSCRHDQLAASEAFLYREHSMGEASDGGDDVCFCVARRWSHPSTCTNTVSSLPLGYLSRDTRSVTPPRDESAEIDSKNA